MKIERFSKHARIGGAILTSRITQKRRPIWVTADLSANCNNRCLYCGHWKRNTEDLPTETWLKFVDECAEVGTCRIGLHGGEPLLHEGCGEIIRKINKHGILSHLYSNGRLVPARRDELLDLDSLILSIDGEETEHDRNRGKGSYRAVIDALDSMAGKVPISAITVLTANNPNGVHHVIELANHYGFDIVVQFLAHTPASSACNGLKEAQMIEILDLLLFQKSKGLPVLNSVGSLKLMRKHVTEYPNAHSIYGNSATCWAGKRYCDVTADGRVLACFESFDRNFEPLKFQDVGFQRAFDQLESFSCNGCHSMCTIDSNLLFSCTIDAVFNGIKFSLK